MPTKGRPQFALRAIDMFLAQTYKRAELVILDEIDNASLPTLPGMQDRVRRDWLIAPCSLGRKRNMLISSAVGDVIVHWDDDDCYHPRRIEDQVQRLLDNDAVVTGYNAMEFISADGARWHYEGSPDYALGVSLCYTRDFWRENPFSDLRIGEDNAFVASARKSGRFVCVPANGMITATIHAGNTSPRDTTSNPKQWRRIAA